jgi:hypothetical protein
METLRSSKKYLENKMQRHKKIGFKCHYKMEWIYYIFAVPKVISSTYNF